MSRSMPVSPNRSINSALLQMAAFLGDATLSTHHLKTFLFVAARGPLPLTQLAAQSCLSAGNVEDCVIYLSQRQQNGQLNGLFAVFASFDRRQKWVTLTARGRELFNLIQSEIHSSRRAA